MSADNWAVCPKCKLVVESILEDKKVELAEQYGKIPAREYLNKVHALNNDIACLKSPDTTLREEYEIGIRDSLFEISYSAVCTVCGFNKNFTHKEVLAFNATSAFNATKEITK